MSLVRSVTAVILIWGSVAVNGSHVPPHVAASGTVGEFQAANGEDALAAVGEAVLRQLESAETGADEENPESGGNRVREDLWNSDQKDGRGPPGATASETPPSETADGREPVGQGGAVAEDQSRQRGRSLMEQPGGSGDLPLAQPTNDISEAIVDSELPKGDNPLGEGQDDGGHGQPAATQTRNPVAGTVNSPVSGDVASEHKKAVSDADGSKPRNDTNNSLDSVLSGSSSEVLLDIEDALDESDLAGQWEREREVMRRVTQARISRVKRNMLLATVFGGVLALLPLAAAAFAGRKWWKRRQANAASFGHSPP